MTRVPKLRANKRILQALKFALRHAELTNCSVGEEHKNAMRLYLSTWVAGPLKDAIADMTGERKARWRDR